MRRLFAGILVTIACVALFGQNATVPDGELQDGFRSLKLGMAMEDAKSALANDPNFLYRGDPDVSFLPSSRIPVIETDGAAFVRHAILQFRSERLFSISLRLDPARLDYFAVYRSLVDQYGEPDRLDPSSATWESDTVRISLEKPLTVKYLDVVEYQTMIDEGAMGDSIEAMTRERFLEQL